MTVSRFVLSILLSLSLNAAAATYYVNNASSVASDTNPGSQTSPWKTIGKAASTMVAGDTAIVMAGSYGEKVSVSHSGSASARITFQASGNAITKTFNVDGSYVSIIGFEMTGADDGYMMTWNGNYGQLLNNVIHDTGASWGIVNGNGSNLTIGGNHYYSSSGPGDDLPVFILGGDNSIAENNEIGPSKDIDAFRAWGMNQVIRGNYIHDSTLTSGSSAHMDVIQTFAVNCTGCTSNVIFEKNIVTSSQPMQIFMTECNTSCSTMGPWEVRNNIYVGVGGQANFGIRNIHFYNNTLYNSGGNNPLVLYLYDAAGKGDYSGAQIKNNIIITPSNITDYSTVVSIGSTGTGVSVDYNFVASMSGFAKLSGFTDAHGINGGNPLFENPSANDFHLQAGSPAIDKGTVLSGYNDDYDGMIRGSLWDIGAFEYSGSQPAPSPTPTSTPAPTPTPAPAPQPTPTPTPTPAPMVGGETLMNSLSPSSLNNSDGSGVNYELGMKFYSVSDGTISAIRFYKSPSETGIHTGKIYDASGNLLASVVFSSETSSGWQQQNLNAPLAISANTTYVVSVNTGNTYYVDTVSGMTSQLSSANLRSIVGGNGVYGPVGAMPTNSWNDSNYFRDLVFVAGVSPTPTPTPAPTPQPTPAPAVDTQAPVVSITSPVNGATVARSTTVTIQASASDNISITKVEFYVNGSLKCTDTAAPYSCNWSVPRKSGKSYNLSAKAYDQAGNVGSSAIVTVVSK